MTQQKQRIIGRNGDIEGIASRAGEDLCLIYSTFFPPKLLGFQHLVHGGSSRFLYRVIEWLLCLTQPLDRA